MQDKDNGYKALFIRLKDNEAKLTVGIHADATNYEDGSSVAEIGSYHEFGTDNIPQRSFLRGWVDANEEKIRNAQRAVARNVIQGTYTLAKGLDRIGQAFVGGIQQRISQGIPPGLKDSTVARKGSSVPLIDTGHLRGQVKHKVT